MNFVPSIINPIYVLIFGAEGARCVAEREREGSGPGLGHLVRKSLLLHHVCLSRSPDKESSVI